MKQNSFCTIQRSSRSLVRTKEFWQTENYKERDRYVVELYKAVKNTHPNKNMHYIREMIFSVDHTIGIDQLVKAAAEIRRFFIIDCFQISIDRKRGQAHLLFDFMNKETMTVVQINQSNFLNLQVLLIKTLGMPIPEEFKEQWSYFSLRSACQYDSEVFQNLLKECSHLKMSKYYYTIIKDLVDFADSRIGSITQRLHKIK